MRSDLFFTLLCLLPVPSLRAQTGVVDADTLTVATDDEGVTQEYLDSVDASYTYASGVIAIAEGAVTLTIPPEFKFLDAAQSHQLMVELWENPPSVAENISGIIMPAGAGVLEGAISFSIEYDTIGYVSDADADAIDYTAMLEEMQHNDSLDNIERVANGYEALPFIGWASPPHYDKQRKALHWAQEFSREDGSANVLNYNIRVLGRRGILILNAMGTMDRLDSVKVMIPRVLDMVAFNDGYRYDQFNAATDKTAAWTVGGLIDGTIKEKIADVVNVVKIIGIAAIAFLVVVAIVVILLVRRKSTTPE